MKDKKGFTLVELLGVIIILSVLLLIAIPNITSTLDKTKKETYLSDAKKLISQAKYELRRNSVAKPTSEELVKITLSYLGTNDVSKDPDGNKYNLEETYVVVVRKNDYLEYYVNLVADLEDGKKKGINLQKEEELDAEDRFNLITTEIQTLDENALQSRTEVTGEVKEYK